MGEGDDLYGESEGKGQEKRKNNHQKNIGGDSAVDPPESIPNSEVKRRNADGSVGYPHVRVGHRQA